MKRKFTKHPKSHSSQLSHDINKYQEWIDYDMERYGKISNETMNDIKKAGFTVTRDQYGDYEVTAAVKCSDLSYDINEYQKWIDYDMKRYGKISKDTMKKIKDAGLTVTQDQYGDYEISACDAIKADTVKKGDKWVNRGDTGEEHGEFETKKEADAQRRAMYAGGYKGPVKGDEEIDVDEVAVDDTDEVDVHAIVASYVSGMLDALELAPYGSDLHEALIAVVEQCLIDHEVVIDF